MALAVPVVALVLLGAADFGRAFYLNEEVLSAARAGAQYGSQSSATASDTAGIKAAALANGTNVSGLSATTSTCTCQSPTPTGQNGCGSGYCNSANSAANYVEVDTTASFHTMLNYPGIPHTANLAGKAIMQIQQ